MVRRLGWALDPRSSKVHAIAAGERERSLHYLQRFWEHLPQHSQIVVFDRSWYGRVLVERVEGFATAPEWHRAYEEINEFEHMLLADGVRLVKLFLHFPGRADAAAPQSAQGSAKAVEAYLRGLSQPRPLERLRGGRRRHDAKDLWTSRPLAPHSRQCSTPRSSRRPKASSAFACASLNRPGVAWLDHPQLVNHEWGWHGPVPLASWPLEAPMHGTRSRPK